MSSLIGIFGGTFDPIHHGHLRLALEVQEQLNLKAVHLIPSCLPAHRTIPLASAHHRLNMLRLAIEGEQNLIADDREIRRQTPSYTIDTVLEIRQEMPRHSLAVIMAMDAFLGFLSWHRYEEILEHAHLIIAHRPSFSLPQAGELVSWLKLYLQNGADYLHQHRAGGIILCSIPPLDISATRIRKQIAIKQNPRYLLPDKVYTYIKKHQIY